MVQRAIELNPDVDIAWVRPSVAPREYQPPTEEQIAAARARVVRLQPSDFPALPAGLARFLEERRCGIPQISPAKEPMNLVRGAFFAAGEPGWAVICSAGGQSEILVFRNDEDRDPHVLSSGADAICLGEEWNCGSYQIAIRPADREFILSHYRAYGGTEPPPIDHVGLDVAIVEKASAVHYFYEGEWLLLAGAD
jgi:hypothetical protein